MKKLPAILLVFVLSLLAACGSDESSDGMKSSEITPLTESQVSNFIYVLPDILDFSEKFQSRMTPEEKDSPEANEKYFKALKESSVIRASVAEHGFQSVDEMLIIYKNVLLEYTTIKRSLTNDAMIDSIRMTIEENRSNYTARLADSSITKDEADDMRKRLNELKNDETRYRNILLVRKYEKELDRVSQNQQQ